MFQKFTPALVIALLAFSLSSFSQSTPLKLSPSLKRAFKQSKFRTERTLSEAQLQNAAPSSGTLRPRVDREQIIGMTRYDLQTNSSCGNRLALNANGTLSATWTMGFSDIDDYTDRGTGYNYFDGTAWQPMPTARIEDNIRTGWPEVGLTASGKQVILNHLFLAPVKLHFVVRDIGTSGAWTESNVPHAPAPGVVWPRMAIGGDNGNTIHAVAITLPTGNDGAEYKGMDGHLLYFRSRDGGGRWDKTEVILPGVDSSYYNFIRGDSYGIDVRGNTVAVVLFSSWGDMKLIKSTDNGETWTVSIINDFPLENYEVNAGYSEDDIPVDPDAPTTLAIRTTDAAGSVIIDENGMVHIAFSTTYVEDSDLGDEGWTYYPGQYGLYYWNESYGTGGAKLVAGLPDSNGNGELDVTGWGDYSQSILSFPSIAADGDGQIFISYSGLVEAFENTNANPEAQTYRHVLIIGSKDGGETWTEPYDIINAEISDPDFYAFFEGVFPSMAKRVDDKIHLIYQQDTEPGLATRGDDADPVQNNNIVYVSLSTEEFFTLSSGREIKEQIADLAVSPNPARGQFDLAFSIKEAGQVSVELLNGFGGKISEPLNAAFYAPGSYRETFQVQNLPKGFYFLKMKMNDQVVVRKICLQ